MKRFTSELIDAGAEAEEDDCLLPRRCDYSGAYLVPDVRPALPVPLLSALFRKHHLTASERIIVNSARSTRSVESLSVTSTVCA
jgi:hypothetical protein